MSEEVIRSLSVLVLIATPVFTSFMLLVTLFIKDWIDKRGEGRARRQEIYDEHRELYNEISMLAMRYHAELIEVRKGQEKIFGIIRENNLRLAGYLGHLLIYNNELLTSQIAAVGGGLGRLFYLIVSGTFTQEDEGYELQDGEVMKLLFRMADIMSEHLDSLRPG